MILVVTAISLRKRRSKQFSDWCVRQYVCHVYSVNIKHWHGAEYEDCVAFPRVIQSINRVLRCAYSCQRRIVTPEFLRRAQDILGLKAYTGGLYFAMCAILLLNCLRSGEVTVLRKGYDGPRLLRNRNACFESARSMECF